jgi:hypothetical protein
MAARLTADELSAFLAAVPPAKRRLVRSLRRLVLRTAPRVDETLLWGAISYHRPGIGGRVKGAVCMIEIEDARVELAFIHGGRLPDPVRLLRGIRRSKRFVPIKGERDLRRAGIVELIREAAMNDWE